MSLATKILKSLLRKVAFRLLKAVDWAGCAVTYSFSLMVNTGTNRQATPITLSTENMILTAV